MDVERADFVMPDAPAAEPSTPGSFQPQFPRSQQSSSCPFMQDHGSPPQFNPTMNSHPNMEMNSSLHRIPQFDPVHRPVTWNSNNPSPHWQQSMSSFPSLSNRPQFGHEYFPGGLTPSVSAWNNPPLPRYSLAQDPFNPSWPYRSPGIPPMQPGRQERTFDRSFEGSHGLSMSMSGVVHHGSEQQMGHSEQQQEQPLQLSGASGADRPPFVPTVPRNFAHNPMHPTLPPPVLPPRGSFLQTINPRSSSTRDFARLPDPRPRTTISPLPPAPATPLESDTRVNVNEMPVQTRSQETTANHEAGLSLRGGAAAADISEEPRAAPPEDQSNAQVEQPSSGSSSDNNTEDSDGESDEEQDPISADEARLINQFHNGAAPYPVRMHEMTEERLRAHQLLRGAMSNKRVASKSALASLQSVDLESLPEKERMCIICYNDFGVATPEGINEAPLRLPKCQHVFGDHCIKKWFEESDSCPYCRDKVESECQIRADARAIDSFLRSTGRYLQGRPITLPPTAEPPTGFQFSTRNAANIITSQAIMASAAAHRGTSTTSPRRTSDETRQPQNNAPQWPGSVSAAWPDAGSGHGDSRPSPASFTGLTPNPRPWPLTSAAHYQASAYPPLAEPPTFHVGIYDERPQRSPPRYPRRSGVNYRSNAVQTSGHYPDFLGPAVQLPGLSSLEVPGRPTLVHPFSTESQRPRPDVYHPPATSGPPGMSGPTPSQFAIPFQPGYDRLANHAVQPAPIQTAWGPQGQ